LLVPQPTLSLEDHPLSAAHAFLFSMFSATLQWVFVLSQTVGHCLTVKCLLQQVRVNRKKTKQ